MVKLEWHFRARIQWFPERALAISTHTSFPELLSTSNNPALGHFYLDRTLMKSILSGVLTGESSWGTMDGVSTADRMLFIIGDPHISRGNSKDPSPTLATYNWPKRCLLLGEVRAYRRGRRRTMFVGGDTTVSIDLLT